MKSMSGSGVLVAHGKEINVLYDLVQNGASDGLRGPELSKRLSESFTREIGLPAPYLRANARRKWAFECRLLKGSERKVATDDREQPQCDRNQARPPDR